MIKLVLISMLWALVLLAVACASSSTETPTPTRESEVVVSEAPVTCNAGANPCPVVY